MNIRWYRVLVVLVPFFAMATLGICEDKPYIFISVPNIVFSNQPFYIQVSLTPPSKGNVAIEMQNDQDISFSERRFTLRGSEKKSIKVKAKPNKAGLAWMHAIAYHADDGYDDGYQVVNMGFTGHLKPSNKSPVPYGTPATLSFSIVDGDGNGLPFDGELELRLESSDAVLKRGEEGGSQLKLALSPGSRSTPQFQITSIQPRGGDLHIAGALYVKDGAVVLTQEELVVSAQPAWWLLLMLAVAGGLLHAGYKLARTPFDSETQKVTTAIWSIVGTSAIAGILGYIFADFDLLGFKLDPNVLRTYPVVGFLFSYLGFDLLLAGKFPSSRRPEQKAPTVDPHVTDTAEKMESFGHHA